LKRFSAEMVTLPEAVMLTKSPIVTPTVEVASFSALAPLAPTRVALTELALES